jgi:hypothetical protein
MSTSLTKKGLLSATDKILVAARPALEIISQFTTDFSDAAVKPGTGVAVDVLAATAEDFVKGTGNYKHTTGTIKNVVVSTDIRKKSTFSLDDLDCLEDETAHCWTKFGPVAGRAVAAELVKSVTGKLTRSARAAAITLAGSTLADFFALRAYMEGTAKIDPATCVVLLEPTTYSLLCSVLNSGIVGDGSVVRGGLIGAALGFKAIYSAPTISTDSAAASDGKGKGFIVPENAIAVVNRVVKPAKGVGGELIEYGEATDEVSGITLTERVVVDGGDGEIFWTSEGLFGSKLTKLDANGNATGAPGFYQVVVA